MLYMYVIPIADTSWTALDIQQADLVRIWRNEGRYSMLKTSPRRVCFEHKGKAESVVQKSFVHPNPILQLETEKTKWKQYDGQRLHAAGKIQGEDLFEGQEVCEREAIRATPEDMQTHRLDENRLMANVELPQSGCIVFVILKVPSNLASQSFVYT
ncbi:hypothetical protein PM082_022010 [Marasmius tenuissimus]|nr:hypothetical protein PM082_022010 [Marasmius tenuissimus]